MWYNVIIKAILSSPLHGLMSKNTMLISLKGRKSGKEYTIPVNYIQRDRTFLVTSYRQRAWWRNLRVNAPVTLRVRGQTFEGIGKAITSKTDVINHLQDYLEQVPEYAKYFKIALDQDGRPNQVDVARAAQERVGIRIYLKNHAAIQL